MGRGGYDRTGIHPNSVGGKARLHIIMTNSNNNTNTAQQPQQQQQQQQHASTPSMQYGAIGGMYGQVGFQAGHGMVPQLNHAPPMQAPATFQPPMQPQFQTQVPSGFTFVNGAFSPYGMPIQPQQQQQQQVVGPVVQPQGMIPGPVSAFPWQPMQIPFPTAQRPPPQQNQNRNPNSPWQ